MEILGRLQKPIEMRIESISTYRYFLQAIKEDPQAFRPYIYTALLVLIFVLFAVFDWDRSLLMCVLLGYACAGVGFFAAYKFRNVATMPFRKSAFQRLILDHLNDVVILQDNRNLKLTYANAAFYKLFAFEQEDNQSLRFEDFVKGDDLRFFRNRKTGKLSIIPLRDDPLRIEMHKQDGTQIWMEQVSKEVIDNGAFTLYNFKEATDKILVEKANQQLAKDLLERKFKEESSVNVISLKVG